MFDNMEKWVLRGFGAVGCIAIIREPLLTIISAPIVVWGSTAFQVALLFTGIGLGIAGKILFNGLR